MADELKPCRCGCSRRTRATWYRGHDEMVRTAVMYALARNTERLAEIFGYGPGLRNAEAEVRAARRIRVLTLDEILAADERKPA